MPRIETRTIALQQRTTRKTKTSVGTTKVNTHKAYAASEERQRHEYHYSGGVTRCSRCPPQRHRSEPFRFCADCARINNARHKAGLIRPTNDPRPSPDNIINPLVVGKYKGPGFAPRFKDSPQPVVTACIEQLGGGWRRGIARLNGVTLYVGNKVRSMDQAWEDAALGAKNIKLGLQFENELVEKYGSL